MTTMEQQPSYWDDMSEDTSPSAIALLIANPDKINWRRLSATPADELIPFFKNNIPKLSCHGLSENTNQDAIAILAQYYPQHINWDYLSANPSEAAVRLLAENPDKVLYYSMSLNPTAAYLIEEHLARNGDNPENPVNWSWISANPSSAAIRILRKYPDNIRWKCLARNTHPDAILLLEENTDKLVLNDCWSILAQNPAAAHILSTLYE